MDEAGSIDASIATLVRPHTGPTPNGESVASRPPAAGAWLSVDTDVSLGGEPAREWLVASPNGLCVTATAVARGESPPEAATLRHVAWAEIDRVRTAAGVGGGMLQVRMGEAWVDLVRYSNALATRFHQVTSGGASPAASLFHVREFVCPCFGTCPFDQSLDGLLVMAFADALRS